MCEQGRGDGGDSQLTAPNRTDRTKEEGALTRPHNITMNKLYRSKFIDGSSDAMNGAAPTSDDDEYLSGYLWGIQTTLKNGWKLEIRWLSPAYINGAYDLPKTGEF